MASGRSCNSDEADPPHSILPPPYLTSRWQAIPDFRGEVAVRYPDAERLRSAGRDVAGPACLAVTPGLLKGEGVWLLSVAMALEYEAICMLADHRWAANATLGDVANLLDSVFNVIVPVEVHYHWRPQLLDAGDEIVLEAAVNGRAEAIVSFNHKDYKGAPGRFGILLRTPAEVLREIRK